MYLYLEDTMHILFLVPYPLGKAPSQRFRFEQYFSQLEKAGHTWKVSPFLDDKAWDIIYKPGHWYSKFAAITRGFWRRKKQMLTLKKYDFVFVHREIVPIGPPIFEWFITRVMRKKVIYDFDDAIWIPNHSEHNELMYYLRRYNNTRTLLSWCHKASCGNQYLVDYAKQYAKDVVYNPTTIDTESYHNRVTEHKNEKFIIGWTGTHSTTKYLNELIPVFKDLAVGHEFEFHVISDKPPAFKMENLKFIPWTKGNEIEDLLKFDVGIMPLHDDKWSQGKCGFKALQYLSLGIPALVSPVGVNTRIVEDGINGFVCNDPQTWKAKLKLLMEDKKQLKELASNCRVSIEKNYSVHSNRDNFLSLFS